ncbi:hypothetical protein OZX67_06370 [Bifidobacterium sp. ESL0728]|uniref:hypothetical protein n=1 Tax=Bifidobacterium sp. ESL0728 TaxID=2983220 RepID=UPI0023F7BBD9|nr:hypothetical protein [Bifidobacterium sp. ESL0728]WEV58449.1 hypothetical protein OZX67_06370 [Bifidobacterium sp. ESL0728]
MVKVSVILPSIKNMFCMGKMAEAAAVCNSHLEVLAKNCDVGTCRSRMENAIASGHNAGLAQDKAISVVKTVGVGSDDE